MKKIYLIIGIFLILLLLFFYGLLTINSKEDTFLEKLIPNEIKNVLKETIFVIPSLNKKINEQEQIIKQQQHRYEDQHNNLNKIIQFIIAKYTDYSLETFPLPLEGDQFVAYIDQTKNKIIFVTGNGIFFSLNKKNIETKEIDLTEIKSNINKIIKNKNFYKSNHQSIRDLLIYKNSIFISYVNEVNKNCYNTSILKADLNFENLKFNQFITNSECQILKTFSEIRRSGGRISPYKENKILLSIGDFGNRPIAQDANSLFGKIISIDILTKKHKIISIGHRNPQGLYYDKKNDVILNTEHGPKGGDELNININPNNNFSKNYGWPISSYGEHYDGKFREEAPLNKSHEKFGFIEPLKYYNPSIAISEIIKIPNSLKKTKNIEFLITSLGYTIEEGDLSIHHIQIDNEYNRIISENIIPIGERIRDILIIEEMNLVLLILENIHYVDLRNPVTLGVLKIKQR